jgi:hypothetical protein
MNLPIKLLGSLAVAGMVAAGGNAFTATGFTTNAPGTAVLGGTVTQNAIGAVMQSVVYQDGGVASTTGLVDTILVTFTTNLPTTATVKLTAYDGVASPISGDVNLVSAEAGGGGSTYTFTLGTLNEANLTKIDVIVS